MKALHIRLATLALAVAVSTAALAADPAQRLADGSLFVPKAMQRALAVRTTVAAAGEFARVVELPGRVVADPQRGGRVQAPQAGIVEGGARGIAHVGQRVRQGEVLARLAQAADSALRAERTGARADTAAQLQLSEARVMRLAQLQGSVPRKEIERAAAERDALRARAAAQDVALDGRVALTAPVAGIVAASHVMPGQVVATGQDLFEIVDPRHLAVEALAWDAGVAQALGDAVADTGDGAPPIALRLLGAGGVLREQALPVLFRIEVAAARPLAVGQVVKVMAPLQAREAGVAVPATAVARVGSEDVVWVHAAAERFVPRRVVVAPLDGVRVRVVSGLAGGERVVAQGAQALAQVR